MSKTINHPIRAAVDDCLSGTETRPSLEKRVLARTHGERQGPMRLSATMAVVLILILVSAVSLAAGVLTGLFRLEQKEIGALQSCVSTGDVLYLITSEGLHSWEPGETESQLLLSTKKLQESGISIDTLLFFDGDCIGLLDQKNKMIWEYENGRLTLQLDFKGTAIDSSMLRYQTAVYQDGWLFLRGLPWNAREEDSLICRINPETGAAEELALAGVLELCAYEPGSLLILSSDIEGRMDTLMVLDTATGTIRETLYTAPVQKIAGLAYDHARGVLYASVGGVLSRWEATGWTALQGYASHHLADAFAVVGDGYAAISYNDMQFLSFEQEAGLATLAIRGFIASDNVDADFQKPFPDIAVVRDRMPTITAESVRNAIIAGDTTDLFHLRLDGSAMSLFAEGLALPLTASNTLIADARDMVAPIAEGLYWEGDLFAVPSLIMNLAWQSESNVPATFEDMLRQHVVWGKESPFIAWNWKEEAWTKADYADYLLTTYIAEKTRDKKGINFREDSFINALTALKEAAFPLSAGGADNAAIVPGITVALRGELPEELSVGDSRIYSSDTDPTPTSEALVWSLPPVVSSNAKHSIPTRLHVYILNPNAQNPERALDYLEYIATHRGPEDEAQMKPDIAEPAMHQAVKDWIGWFVADQREEDVKNGVKTDEATLQANVDAIYAAPDSWVVTDEKLTAYQETIVPYLDLRLHPWLSSDAKLEGGIYPQMLQVLMEYIDGNISIEDCMACLDVFASK